MWNDDAATGFSSCLAELGAWKCCAQEDIRLDILARFGNVVRFKVCYFSASRECEVLRRQFLSLRD